MLQALVYVSGQMFLLFTEEKKQLPAVKLEIKEPKEERISITFLVAPVEYICKEDLAHPLIL
jgi:hypothetical protein